MLWRNRAIAFVLAGSLSFITTACTFQPENPESSPTAVQSTKSAVSDSTGVTGQEVSGDIHIDQLGYRNNDKKIAVINGQYDKFEIIDAGSKNVAFSGKTEGKVKDVSSEDTVCYADFSAVTVPGSYYINIPGLGRSYTFLIGENVYDNAADSLVKALYYQRCGSTLEEKYAGDYQHAACHLSKAVLYQDGAKEIDTTGGWHDAGDYGKYIVPTAVTASHLMLAYEFYPESFGNSESIPESGNHLPDILDEAKYGIAWMLKMQEPVSGGVYHKVTSKDFPDSMTMPQEDLDLQYVMPISTTATADFAAATALAARIFGEFDPSFSQKCLEASKRAWGWLQANKNFVAFKNPQDMSTGEYGDDDSGADEITWAAAELFRTTGEKAYNDYFMQNYKSNGFGLGWQSVSGFAAIAYLFNDSTLVDGKKSEEIRSGWLAKADMFVSTAKNDGYLLAMHKMEYNWGSNMNVTNHAIHLLVADKLNNSPEYTETAENCAHYLLGRNTLDQSYITGLGSKQVMQPAHRPSMGDGAAKPVPGLVVGGPDAALEDDVAKEKLAGLSPAQCYIDDMNSYSTNEVATYWNSSAIFVFGYMHSHK